MTIKTRPQVVTDRKPVTAADRPDIQFLIDEYKAVRGLVNHDPKIPQEEVTTVALHLTDILFKSGRDGIIDLQLERLASLRDDWRKYHGL